MDSAAHRHLTLIRPPGVKRTNFTLGLEKKNRNRLFAKVRDDTDSVTVPVSDFVSKRATDRGLHQTLIEAQWCG